MKKIIKYITENIRPPLLLLLTISFAPGAIGQDRTPIGERFKNIAKPGSTLEWMDFWQDTKINPNTVFTDLKDTFGLSADDRMTISKVKKDDIGYTH